MVEFDLPGVSPDAIDLTVQRIVLAVHATRASAQDEQTRMLVAERARAKKVAIQYEGREQTAVIV